MILVCHVISQDHATKGWSNIMGRVTSLLSLVATSTVVVEL